MTWGPSHYSQKRDEKQPGIWSWAGLGPNSGFAT